MRLPRLNARLAPDFVENPTAEDFARAARWALQAGDLPRAMEQVSAALALAPQERTHRDLLDTILSRAPRPRDLVALPPDEAFYGLCAAHAHALTRLGEIDGALAALFEVAAFSLESPFLEWGVEWTASAKGRRGVRPGTVAHGLVRLTESARTYLAKLPQGASQGLEQNLLSALVIAERIQLKCQTHDELRVARSRALRLLQRLEDADRCIAAGSKKSWAILVEQAALAGDRGDEAARLSWLQRAVRVRPDVPETHCDLGRTLLDEGHVREAITSYEAALELHGCPSDALVQKTYAQALVERRRLLPNDFPPDAHGATVQALCRDLHAYHTRLPDPIDPLIAVVRTATSQAAKTNGVAPLVVRVNTERPASASLRLALRYAVSRVGRSVQLETVLLAGNQSAEDEAQPSEAPLDPFSEEQREILRATALRLARSAFEWQRWCDDAQLLAQGSDVWGWLSNSTAPPDDETRDAVQWVHGFQVACALLAANARGDVSERFAALEQAALGDDDWHSAAAVLGLRALAERHHDVSGRVVALYKTLIPPAHLSVGVAALALAVSGDVLAEEGERRVFWELRARVLRELAELSH